MLKVISWASFQRSSDTQFATLSAKQRFKLDRYRSTNQELLDENGMVALYLVRWCLYAGIHGFREDQIQYKTQAEARFRCPSFSRFGRCGEASCGRSKIADDLLPRAPRHKRDVRSKRRCKALRCQ